MASLAPAARNISRRFWESYSSAPSRMGSRLALSAACAPELAVPTPTSSSPGDLRSLAPLLLPGAALQEAGALQQETVLCALQGLASSSQSFSLQSLPPLAGVTVGATPTASSAGKRRNLSCLLLPGAGLAGGLASFLQEEEGPGLAGGLASFLQEEEGPGLAGGLQRASSSALQEAVLCALRGLASSGQSSSLHTTFDILEDAAPLHMFGAGIASLSGMVFNKPAEEGDESLQVPTPPPGTGTGVGGGGGSNGDDTERYLLVMELLLQLCKGIDDKGEARCHFQRLKQMMIKEWYNLHIKREALNRTLVEVETTKENNEKEKMRLDAQMERLSEQLRDVSRREEELKAGAGKMEVDRASLDKQLQEADLGRKELEGKLLRVDLDRRAVMAMWIKMKAEEASGSEGGAASTDEHKENKGGDEEGSKGKEEKSGFWSLLRSLTGTTERANALYKWCKETYWLCCTVGVFGGRLLAVDDKGMLQFLETLEKKHEEKMKEAREIADMYGLRERK